MMQYTHRKTTGKYCNRNTPNPQYSLSSLPVGSKGLITLCVVSLAFFYFSSRFLFSLVFFLAFCYLHVGIKNVRKMQEKCEKYARNLPNTRNMRENCPIREKRAKMFLYYIIIMLGKKREPVAFFSHFLAFLLTNLTKTQTKCIV